MILSVVTIVYQRCLDRRPGLHYLTIIQSQ